MRIFTFFYLLRRPQTSKLQSLRFIVDLTTCYKTRCPRDAQKVGVVELGLNAVVSCRCNALIPNHFHELAYRISACHVILMST